MHRFSTKYHTRWVMLGSGFGGAMRHLISVWLNGLTPVGGFPWAIILVNVSGCFLIGVLSVILESRFRALRNPRARHFLLIGFCGGYTTFSIFSLETMELWMQGMEPVAMTYVAATIAGSLMAVYWGVVVAGCLRRNSR